jgi:regulator of sigma E protease
MLSMIRDLIAWAPVGIPAFIFVLAIVVFVHELGHFLVARACGVGVKSFSIGFGPEMFGWTDKKGTRWKISWLPLGGFVMFEGDANAASLPDPEAVAKMTDAEKSRALPLKPLWQRAAVSAAGPFANFVLAFVVFTLLFGISGARTLSTYVGGVQERSPAAEAGVKPGDKITKVDGKAVTYFPDLVDAIQGSKNTTLVLTIQRQGESLDVPVTPRVIAVKDVFGTAQQSKAIGVARDETSPQNIVTIPIPWTKAPWAAALQSYGIADASLTYLWRIVSHRADASQLGGPIRIAKVAKSAASAGFYELISLIAFISVSIGLINLFPIPLLDGGHLLYYACEGVLGRPLTERTQDVGFRLGLALVIGLMIFATWNDLVR